MKLFAATGQGESSTIQYHLTKKPQLFLALSGVRSALSPWFADYPSGWRLALASNLLSRRLFRFHQSVSSECDPCRESSGIVKTDK